MTSSRDDKIMEFTQLKRNIEKFVLYKYPEENDWLEFLAVFSKTDDYSLEEKLNCLTSIENKKSLDTTKWWLLLISLLNYPMSHEKIFPKILTGTIFSNEELSTALLRKINQIELSFNDLFFHFMFPRFDSSLFEVINLANNKEIWNLLSSLMDYLEKDNSLAPKIYDLLMKKSINKGLSIGHAAIKEPYTAKLFFKLLQKLEQANIKRDKIYEIFKLTDETSNSILFVSLLAITSDEEYSAAVTQYHLDILQLDNILEFLSPSFWDIIFYLSKNHSTLSLYFEKIEEALVPLLDRFIALSSNSNDIARTIAKLFSENATEFLIRGITSKNQTLIQLAKKTCELIDLFLTKDIYRNKFIDILKAATSYFKEEKPSFIRDHYKSRRRFRMDSHHYEEKKASSYFVYLREIVLNSRIEPTIMLSIMRNLLQHGLASKDLYSLITKGYTGYHLNGFTYTRSYKMSGVFEYKYGYTKYNSDLTPSRRFSEFLAMWYKCTSSSEETKSMIKNIFIEQTLAMSGEEYKSTTYAKEVMLKYPNDAGEILYPLIKADILPHSEFDANLRGMIFDHILTLPPQEREITLKEIKQGIQPMKELFWDNNDILFIHRAPTLSAKLSARIDKELEALQFSASSPRLFSSTSARQQNVHQLMQPDLEQTENSDNRKERIRK